MKKLLTRICAGSFVFFFVKGLVWLVILAISAASMR